MIARLTAGSAALAAPEIVFAQLHGADDTLRVEVTGSHIRRSDVESALPVQVITREEIERRGVTTVADLMAQVSANMLAFNDQRSVGAQLDPEGRPRPGLSSVNLRGLGDSSTLVLVNGRRVANYAFDGGAVDINSIPLAAIDRVEILKDGASAIYGTDAIAGVVNFILRQDFSGVELSAYGTHTAHGGGNQWYATFSAGYGDLAKDKYNVFVTANYQNDEGLHASERSYSQRGFQPEIGLNTVNFNSFPANIAHPELGLVNPSWSSGCRPPYAVPHALPVPQWERACAYDVGALADIYPPVERAGVFGRATIHLGPDLTAFTEVAYARNRFDLTLPATPATQRFMRGGVPVLYPESGPYYPRDFANAIGLTGDLNLLYRTEPLGIRLNSVETHALRALLGVEGRREGWDVAAGLLYSRNEQQDDLVRGYVSQDRLLAALATGRVNPFGPSGPDGDALLADAQVYGRYHEASGSTWLVDAKASRELAALPGGGLAIAFGAEARREQLENDFSALVQGGDVIGVGGALQPVSSSRDVQAIHAEAVVPFAPSWEMQLAARYDHYSDFGGTVNPKVALRWQPDKRILLRSSWGTGYRAPTLYDLHTPLLTRGTTEFRDPIRCPVTGSASDCLGEVSVLVGGNPDLQPEQSTQLNVGAVWEPFDGLSFAVDYWKIDKDETLAQLTAELIVDDYARWASTNIVRGPADPAYPGLPGPISAMILGYANLGQLATSGIDVDVRWHGPATAAGRFGFSLNGTYILNYDLTTTGSPTIAGAGNAMLGPLARWRHYASLTWEQGPWSAALAQRFVGAYREPDDLTYDWLTGEHSGTRRVGTYSLVDLQVQYKVLRDFKVATGVRNLFDRDPPFTQYPVAFASAGNAYYADPRGRTLYLSLTYAFR